MFESVCEQFDPSDVNGIKFWNEMMEYMMRVIEEDQKIYGPVLNQFPQELSLGTLSITTLWQLYKTDLRSALEGIHILSHKLPP